jgi:hypothetical protein
LVSDGDELGLLSKARPREAKPLDAVTQIRDGIAWNNLFSSATSLGLCLGGRLGHGFREGLEALSASPDTEQHHRQLAGHRDDGTFLAAFASSGGQLKSPPAQCRVRPEAAQNVLGRLHKQTAEIGIAEKRAGGVWRADCRHAVARIGGRVWPGCTEKCLRQMMQLPSRFPMKRLSPRCGDN